MKQYGISDFVTRNGRTTIIAVVIAMLTYGADAASVVQRPTAAATQSRTAPRANNAARMPTLVANTTNSATTTNTATDAATTTDVTTPDTSDTSDAVNDEPEIIVENKSSQFAETLSDVTNSRADTSSSDLAEKIRQQRAALNAQSAAETAASAAATLATGYSACDTGLRECMQKKCGDDFTDCATDGDTIWGDKMDACRRDTNCTAHQYQLFSREIKADRDLNVAMSSFDNIIKCGNEYNSCIVTQCGEKYTKCLGKSAGDAAIAACAKIANKCKTYDSGLAYRTTEVFGNFRQNAEKQVAADEQRLYELRDKMAAVCQRMGAAFDERSLVCVYTVNFFAGNSTTPMASKKMYAGATFDCNQDWFGIDVTTFKENAYRETRAQTSASSSFMGAGIGTAAGAITSGAIDRALDRQKAEKAAKNAQNEHNENFENNEAEQKDGKKSDKGNDNKTPQTTDTPTDGSATAPTNSGDPQSPDKATTPTESPKPNASATDAGGGAANNP